MTVTLSDRQARTLVAQAGAVVAKSPAHPILAYVVIEGSPGHDATIRAASAVAHGVWPLGKGSLREAVAIRWEHLAAIIATMTTETMLVLDGPTAGTVTASTAEADGVSIGTWAVPIAARSELALFPPEPAVEAGAPEADTYHGPALAAALGSVAWSSHAEGTVQLVGNTVYAATWSTAHQRRVGPLPASSTKLLPTSAARVLRATLEASIHWPVEWAQDAHRHHITGDWGRLHLAQPAGAVDDTAASFFRPPPAQRGQQLDARHVQAAARRAAALHDYVTITGGSAEFHIEATDGSSRQSCPVLAAGSELGEAFTLPARDLVRAMEAFITTDDFIVAVESPTAGTGTVIWRGCTGQAVAMVPLAPAS